MKVVVRILHSGTIDPLLTRWMMWAAKKYHLWDIEPFFSVEGVVAARNYMVSDFLQGDGDRLWLIDSAITPPRSNAIVKHDFPVLCGVYGIHLGQPGALPSLYKMNNAYWDTLPVNQWPEHKVFKVDGAGLGCVVIEREVLESMEPPWFHYGSSDYPHDNVDMAFSRKVGGVHVVRDCTCQHVQSIDVSPEVERTMMANLGAYAVQNDLLKEQGPVDPPEVAG